jgi:predicted O-methyltransferase YrrM
MRRALRTLALTLDYAHPAAVTVAWRRGPRAAARYLSEMYRCSKTDAGRYLPTVTLDEIAPVPTEFTVYRPGLWQGSLTLSEVSSLCHLMAARRPHKVLEIGTFRGATTLNLALNAKDAEIHTLDLPPDVDPATTRFDTADVRIIRARAGYAWEGRPEALRIHQHRSDSATFAFETIGGGVDFCLIDAAHSYAYVRQDTAKVLPLMADEGLLLWHDYGRNDFLAEPTSAWGVTRFLHEAADAGIAILHGTSFGLLVVTATTRRRLAAHLDAGDGHP